MKVGDEVQILSGKHAGFVGVISFAHPGYGGRYYFRVRLEPGVVIEATSKRLRLVQSAAVSA